MGESSSCIQMWRSRWRPLLLACSQPVSSGVLSFSCSYTKLGYAGNTEPQFIVPSCEYSSVQPVQAEPLKSTFICCVGVGGASWVHRTWTQLLDSCSGLHRKAQVLSFPAGIAIKESAKVGDQAQRRMMKGVDDLDFYIGDEAVDKPSYSTKVTDSTTTRHAPNSRKAHYWSVSLRN